MTVIHAARSAFQVSGACIRWMSEVCKLNKTPSQNELDAALFKVVDLPEERQ